MSFHPLVSTTIRRKVASALRNNGDSYLIAVIKANKLSATVINATVQDKCRSAGVAIPAEFSKDFAVTATDHAVHHDGAHTDVAALGPILQGIIDFFTAHPEIIQAIVTALIALL